MFCKLKSYSNIFSLPESGAHFDKSVESRSFDAYKFLQNNEYSLVYFGSNHGVGYFSLSSHKQGLLAKHTKFIVGLDSLPIYSRLKIEGGSNEHLVTDLIALKEKFLIEKSASLSVH